MGDAEKLEQRIRTVLQELRPNHFAVFEAEDGEYVRFRIEDASLRLGSRHPHWRPEEVLSWPDDLFRKTLLAIL